VAALSAGLRLIGIRGERCGLFAEPIVSKRSRTSWAIRVRASAAYAALAWSRLRKAEAGRPEQSSESETSPAAGRVPEWDGPPCSRASDKVAGIMLHAPGLNYVRGVVA
jgi:hypothetical protein